MTDPAASGAGFADEPPIADRLERRDTAAAQARNSTLMSVATLGSRALGVVRILVVSAAFGASFLGSTYQTANNVPNVIFELIAAGALSSVLVPTLVDLLHRDAKAEAESLAGGVLGVALAVLGGLMLVGIVAAHPIAELLYLAERDATVRAAKVALGTSFLRWFLPQVMLYAIAMVATGVLQAHRKFLVPALAPAWNNVVVIAVYGGFAVMFGAEATLAGTSGPAGGVSPAATAWLGAGTTLGVAALALGQLPFVARTGFRLRPKLAFGDPGVRRIARLGIYAVGYLGLNAVVLQVMTMLANAGENVVPLQVAWALFLLPYSLFAMTLATAAFPAISRMFADGDDAAFSAESARLIGNVAFCLVPVAVGFATLAAPIAVVFRFGRMTPAAATSVGALLAAMAWAVPAYGLFLALTRINYARHDTRWPTLASLVGSVVTVAALFVGAAPASGTPRLWAMGLSLAAGSTVSCVVAAVGRRHIVDWARSVGQLARCALAACAMAAVAWPLGRVCLATFGTGRLGAAGSLAVAGGIGTIIYLGVTRALQVEAWRLVVRR